MRGLVHKAAGTLAGRAGWQLFWLLAMVVAFVATPGISLAAGGDGGAFNAIGNVARTIYGWLKAPALAVAIFIGAVGLFKWLIKGANNPKAHKEGLNLVLGVIIMVFLIFTLDGILTLVTQVGNDVSDAMKQGGGQ